MSNPNANVRLFTGPINAAAYWIGDHLLRAGDIVNNSTVTGATVKDALNTLSSASSALYPFTSSGLAEQDLVSYDAGAGTWRNRTVAAALKGVGLNSVSIGSSNAAGGSRDVSIGEQCGLSSTSGFNVSIGRNTFNNVSTSSLITNVVAVGRNCLNGALTSTAAGSVAVGSNVFTSLTSGSNCIGIGSGVGTSATTATHITLIGSTSNCSATADSSTFVGFGTGTSSVGVNNSILGAQCLGSAAAAVRDCVAIGAFALSGVISSTGPSGSVAIGSTALQAVTTGVNTAIGFAAGLTLTTGTNNTIVGYSADVTAVSRSGCVIIGRGASGAADDTLVIRMGNTSTKELTITPVTDATIRVANTYLPIRVGATQYYIQLHV